MFPLLQIASPSIESFSTLPDQEDVDFSFDTDAGDLQVRVDNPQKHLDTLETYVSFRICTKVNLVSINYMILANCVIIFLCAPLLSSIYLLSGLTN